MHEDEMENLIDEANVWLEERQHMILFVLQIYSNYTKEMLNVLNDDELNALFLDALRYSKWGE